MSEQAKVTTPFDEDLLIVDQLDQVVGRAAKADIHLRRLYHRQAYVFIENSAGQLLLQQRSRNRYFDPGAWTSSASGHVAEGESYLAAALREVYEELGIHLSAGNFLGKVLAYSEKEGQLCGGPSAVYCTKSDISVQECVIQQSEVETIAYFPVDVVQNAVRGDQFIFNGEAMIVSHDFPPVLRCLLENRDDFMV